jgi:uncharacterized protein (DUF1499 family)
MDKIRDIWVRAALVLSLLVPLYFLFAALGTKFGLLDWTVGFGAMTYQWGSRILMGVGAFALIAVLLALFVPPRRGIVTALMALIIPAAGIGYGMYVRNAAADIPPIHDISTDLIDPPAFSEGVVEARAAVTRANDLDLLNKRTGDGRAFTELQSEAYPDIAAVATGLDPTRAFDIALALAREQNWRIGRVAPEAGVIEATAETFWFGFIDDIAIRVRPDGTGARIDMRSVSRVGRSDIGANAARMRPYLQELRRRIEEAEGAA